MYRVSDSAGYFLCLLKTRGNSHVYKKSITQAFVFIFQQKLPGIDVCRNVGPIGEHTRVLWNPTLFKLVAPEKFRQKTFATFKKKTTRQTLYSCNLPSDNVVKSNKTVSHTAVEFSR